MPQHRRASGHSYAFAIAAVVGMTGFWFLLRLLAARAPEPILIVSVALSSFQDGLGPSLSSALLTSLASQFVVFHTNVSFFDFDNILRVGVFFLVGLLTGAGLARPREKTSAQPYRHKHSRAMRHTRRRYLSMHTQHVSESLRLNEERFRTVLKGSRVAVFNQDRNLRYTWIHNPQMGMSPEEVLGKTERDLFEPPEEAAALQELKRRVMVTGVGARHEVKIHRKGEEYYIDMFVEPLHDSSGGVTGITCVAVDITDRKRVTLALKQAQEERNDLLRREHEARCQAEAASRAKDEFLAILSHEMRTPLTSILGWVQMIRRGRVDAARLQRGLEVIERNGHAQARLIEDLLDVSRIISGKMTVEKKPVEICQVVDTTIEAMRPTAEAKGITLEYEQLDHVERVLGDRERLGQVITNLLSNAIKFTPRGGRAGLRMRRVDDEVEMQVRDTGIGIDPSFLPYLFNRFQQADTSITRQYQGLGLGLAIVKYLVELHGGRVWAESPGKGEGAVFTVKLPVLTQESGVEESPIQGSG